MAENTKGGAPLSPETSECLRVRDIEVLRAPGAVRRGRRTMGAVALVLLASVGACEDETLEPTIEFGRIQGSVTVAGAPQAGVTIMADRRGNSQDRRFSASNASGRFIFFLDTDSWTVTVAPIAGAECPQHPNVDVFSSQTATRDFECTLIPGTMAGVVTLDGVPVPGLTVLIANQHSGDVTSAVTDGEGAYMISLAPGRYAASATIFNASCEGSPQTVDVVASGTVSSNVVCQSILGTVLGTVTLDGEPAVGVTVDIVEYSAGQPVIVSVLTDDQGTYLALVTPGVRSVKAKIADSVCAGLLQVTVKAGEDAVANLACFLVPGFYSATFTETSNTCSIPLAPAFTSPLAVGFTQTGAQSFIDILPGDRPEETTATGPYDPDTGAASLVSPPFENSGIIFQEFWTIVFGLSDPGATFGGTSDVSQSVVGVTVDGTVDVTLAVGGTVVCSRTYGVEATRTGS